MHGQDGLNISGCLYRHYAHTDSDNFGYTIKVFTGGTISFDAGY